MIKLENFYDYKYNTLELSTSLTLLVIYGQKRGVLLSNVKIVMLEPEVRPNEKRSHMHASSITFGSPIKIETTYMRLMAAIFFLILS